MAVEVRTLPLHDHLDAVALRAQGEAPLVFTHADRPPSRCVLVANPAGQLPDRGLRKFSRYVPWELGSRVGVLAALDHVAGAVRTGCDFGWSECRHSRNFMIADSLRHTSVMRSEPPDDADPIGPIADEIEAGYGPVALVRPGHLPVVLVSAEHWARLLDIDSTAMPRP